MCRRAYAFFQYFKMNAMGIPLGRSKACATESIRKNIYCERGKRRYNERERFIAGGEKSGKKKKY